jgi:hypothetical protein
MAVENSGDPGRLAVVLAGLGQCGQHGAAEDDLGAGLTLALGDATERIPSAGPWSS